RYNRIFRKELDSFDQANAYGGNLTTLENILKNRVQWNGITISSGVFDDLNNWDVNGGYNQNSYDVNTLFTAYVKNKENTNVVTVGGKGRRRRRYNRITK